MLLTSLQMSDKLRKTDKYNVGEQVINLLLQHVRNLLEKVGDMKSLKQYARERGISVEAVRRQLVRYSEELEGHVTTQNRAKYIDDEAEQFLDNHRLRRTVVLEPTEEEVASELEAMRFELDRLKNEVVRLQGSVIKAQEENKSLIEYRTKYEGLIEYKEHTEKMLAESQESQRKMGEELGEVKEKLRSADHDLQRADQELTELKERLSDAEREAQSYQKTFFGFYRKK